MHLSARKEGERRDAGDERRASENQGSEMREAGEEKRKGLKD